VAAASLARDASLLDAGLREDDDAANGPPGQGLHVDLRERLEIDGPRVLAMRQDNVFFLAVRQAGLDRPVVRGRNVEPRRGTKFLCGPDLPLYFVAALCRRMVRQSAIDPIRFSHGHVRNEQSRGENERCGLISNGCEGFHGS